MWLLEIQIIGHCRRRMKQRGVTEQQIELTVQHPNRTYPTPTPSTCYERTMTDGRTLKVWVQVPETGSIRVVNSVAWKDE